MMTLTVAVVTLAFVTSLMTSVRASGHCADPIPGADKMMLGVDVSKLDIYDRSSFKRSVLAMSCTEDKKTAWNDGTEKQLPDQITLWVNTPAGTLSTRTRVIETMSDVTDTVSVNVDVEGEYGPVSGSASAAYSRMQQDIAENKYFYSITEATENTATVELKLPENLELSPGANQTLPWGVDYDRRSRTAFFKWIGRFGTHFFIRGYFGAVIRSEIKTQVSLKNQYSKEQLSLAATVAYNGLVGSAKVAVSTDMSSDRMSKQFNSMSEKKIQYYGGDVNLMKDGGLEDWQPSVKSNPYLRAGKLEPLTELIKDDRMRTQMELAVDDYLRAWFITNTRRTISTFSKSYQGNKHDLKHLKAFGDSLTEHTGSLEQMQMQFDDRMQEIASLHPGRCPTYTLTTYTGSADDAGANSMFFMFFGDAGAKPKWKEIVAKAVSGKQAIIHRTDIDLYILADMEGDEEDGDGYLTDEQARRLFFKRFTDHGIYPLIDKLKATRADQVHRTPRQVDRYELGSICGIRYNFPQEITINAYTNGATGGDGWQLDKAVLQATFSDGTTTTVEYPCTAASVPGQCWLHMRNPDNYRVTLSFGEKKGTCDKNK